MLEVRECVRVLALPRVARDRFPKKIRLQMRVISEPRGAAYLSNGSLVIRRNVRAIAPGLVDKLRVNRPLQIALNSCSNCI